MRLDAHLPRHRMRMARIERNDGISAERRDKKIASEAAKRNPEYSLRRQLLARLQHLQEVGAAEHTFNMAVGYHRDLVDVFPPH